MSEPSILDLAAGLMAECAEAARKNPVQGVRVFGGHRPGCWPKKSCGLWVHPKTIPEAMEAARKRGICVDFAPDGDAIVTDRGQRRDYCEMRGLFDMDGGYGDAQSQVVYDGEAPKVYDGE